MALARNEFRQGVARLLSLFPRRREGLRIHVNAHRPGPVGHGACYEPFEGAQAVSCPTSRSPDSLQVDRFVRTWVRVRGVPVISPVSARQVCTLTSHTRVAHKGCERCDGFVPREVAQRQGAGRSRHVCGLRRGRRGCSGRHRAGRRGRRGGRPSPLCIRECRVATSLKAGWITGRPHQR